MAETPSELLDQSLYGLMHLLSTVMLWRHAEAHKEIIITQEEIEKYHTRQGYNWNVSVKDDGSVVFLRLN